MADNDKLLNSPAYLMFVEELDKHLAMAEEVVGRLDAGRHLTSAERTTLSTAFHTIRGGAGFFALTEIAQMAKHLEERLQTNPAKDDSAEIKALVQKLANLASSLPR